jgi:hypothetical protein
MMPVEPKPAPTDKTLKICIGRYRKRAKTHPIATVWKNFRGSDCGKQWLDALHNAYGHRCLCCDHAEGRTIDHRDAKSLTASRAFAWKNHRPCCMDCNNLKGTKTIVDPLTEDPRAFVVFDVYTGTPDVSPEVRPRQRKKAEDTLPLLDNQTLNEARRAKLRRVLDVLTRFLDDEAGFGRERVLAEFDEAEPHRAIVRDLILGAEDDLHRWSALVRHAMRRIRRLKAWALAPIARPRPARARARTARG